MNPLNREDVGPEDRRRFCLTDDDLQELARQAVVNEKHFGRPMDIERGNDGKDGHLYILQGRPETVTSRTGQFVERYRLKDRSRILTEGRAIGQRIEPPYDRQELDLETMPELPIDIMMNVGNPDRAFDFSSTPHRGIGLARAEFIINRMIGVHPKALINFDAQPDDVKATIQELASGYPDPVSFYVGRLSEGIAMLAAAFAPHPAIVRMSDFKSSEYANLVGGAQYEPDEENPMLGFRGGAQYVSDSLRDCFELEVRAIRRVREDMGLDNVQVMIPFLRTVGEAEAVTRLLRRPGSGAVRRNSSSS